MGACTPVGVGEVREMLGELRRQEMGKRGDHAGRRVGSCRLVVDYLSISGPCPRAHTETWRASSFGS
jgi:hypothetical protein